MPRNPTTPGRPRARSLEADLVAAPAHDWEYRLPKKVLEKPKNKPAMIQTIAEMMASGDWRTGVSAVLLARAWGMMPGSVQNSAAEASRLVRGAVDIEALQRIANESVQCLMENGYAARDEGNINGSTVAFTKAAELCLAMLKSPGDAGEPKQTEREAFNRLRELGWTPPNTLLGLPAPNVMGPTTTIDSPRASRDGQRPEESEKTDDDE